jgi:BioD-like phosphotransacetylase family protein
MARKLFIAATGQNSGKTTTSLSLMHMARKKYKRVGFIKPIGPKPSEFKGIVADKDAIVMARVYGLESDLSLMSPFVLSPGDTRRFFDGELSAESIRQRIQNAIEILEEKNDFLIIEGAGHSGVGSVLGFSNAQIARQFDASVLMVAGGGLGDVVDSVHLNLALFEKHQASVRAILTNKIIPEKRDRNLKYLSQAFSGLPIKVIGGFNYQPILANPTLRRVSNVLNVPLCSASEAEAQRIAHHIQIGAASTQRVTELLGNSSLVVVNRSRDELLVTLANLYQIAEYKEKIAGLVIPGIGDVSRITQTILDRSGIPYIRVNRSTSEVFAILSEDVSKITAEDTHKIDLIQELAELRFDFDSIDALLD